MSTITIGELIAENEKLREDNRELRKLYRKFYATIVKVLKDEKKNRMKDIIKLVEDV